MTLSFRSRRMTLKLFMLYHRSACRTVLRSRFLDVPVPRIIEAAVEVMHVTPRECVQNRTPDLIVDMPVPRIAEEAVRVTPQECVVNRTPEQLVDEPVPQIDVEIVEWLVPSERIHELVVEQMRELHEALRRFYEQNALEEEEEEDDEDDDVRHFAPGFRPRRWCRFLVEGACCPYGNRCTFAHHESEFSGGTSDSVH